MYQEIAEACRMLMQESDIEILIPYGTAVQNARTTELKYIGDGGYLSADGTHMQEGVACQIGAYVMTQLILNHLGLSYSIYGETTRVNEEWIKGKNIPGPQGLPIGSNDRNCGIAQTSALAALTSPLEVTQINVD